MRVRKYHPSDCEKIYKLFYDTVHFINVKDYSKEQLNVWATGKFDFEKWNKSFLENHTIVAIEGEEIIGFGDIDSTGYLDHLYTHKDYQGIGVATTICNELERNVNTNKITTHASITAKSFFEGRGYSIVKEQKVKRGEQLLTNYIMGKQITREEGEV